ncbi:hypothetical protein N9917_04380 [Deltaproteobacteria bacterium]|nr:hypothetical protein [Deltaproteobacteria bacterium]
MTFKASWSFLDESANTLTTKLGWVFSNQTDTGYWNTYSADTYTYDAYPGTHWVMAGHPAANFILPPTLSFGGNLVGCWTFAMKFAGTSSTGSVVRMDGLGGWYNMVTLLAPNVFSLYVQQTFKESSDAIDLGQWHYYCFKSDMVSNPYKAEFWMDGVMILSGTHAQATPRDAGFMQFWSRSNATYPNPNTGTLWAGISYWDDYADPAQTIAYFSTGDPTKDLSEAPTWVATSGDTDRFTEVSGVYDEAKNVSLAAPADGNNVTLGIGGAGGTDDIGDQLGIGSGTILGISLHTWAMGEGVSAHAAIGDGSNVTAGATSVISDTVDPTHLHIGTAVSPTGPAWVMTDQPEMIFEVD